MKSSNWKLWAGALLLASLNSTAFAEKKSEIAIKVPTAYIEQPQAEVAKDVSSLAEWWKNFNDPELQSLIQRAIESNLDVRIAQAKLRESRATLNNTRYSKEIPTVNVEGTYTRSKTSQSNPSIPKLGSNTTLIPSTYGVYQTYFDASYEIDIFGGVRNQVKAARADAEAQAEDLRNTLVSTLAEVAKDYIQLREYQEELKVAHENEASELDTLKITKVRNKAGLVSDQDVANAAANVASTQSQIPTLEREINQEIHAIAVLLGETPGELVTELSKDSDRGLPAAPTELPVDMPSDLLRRRPDIREAERNVAAAAARVGVQKSKLFPSISLSAQYGGQSGSVGTLVNAAARYYSVGPTIEWGILNYPATKANIRTYQAKKDEQVLTYQKTVLTAFQDVEDALTAYTKERSRQKTLDEEVTQYKKAADLAILKYTRGLSTFLDVLDAQRSLYNAQDSLVQSRATVQTDLIALYKALGGGWEKNDPVTVAQNTKP